MKKYLLLFAIIVLASGLSAQNAEMQQIAAKRKTDEIARLVKLRQSQRDSLENYALAYYRSMDSAAYKMTDMQQAAKVKYAAEKQFTAHLLKSFTPDQSYDYIKNLYLVDIGIEVQQKTNTLKELNKYDEARIQEAQKKISDYLIKKYYNNLRYKGQPEKLATQNNKLKKSEPQIMKEASEHEKIKRNDKGKTKKVEDIKKYVQLTPEQEKELEIYAVNYKLAIDSIRDEVKEPKQASRLKYNEDKKWMTQVISSLSDLQLNTYVKNSSAEELDKKTQAKLNSLRNVVGTTEEEIQLAYDEIYNYLLLEKIVYVRDKYDIEKQKENISQLKKHEPYSLKRANAQAKIKHQGKKYQGRYQW